MFSPTYLFPCLIPTPFWFNPLIFYLYFSDSLIYAYKLFDEKGRWDAA